MRTIIVGCGRVGAGLASQLAEDGHEVVILDQTTEAFRRLEPDFPGQALRGDGTDESVLRRAGAEGADWFLALTNGDNRNILAAQLASETFGIPQRHLQDQRPGARAGLRHARREHGGPDGDDDRCHRSVHGSPRHPGRDRRHEGGPAATGPAGPAAVPGPAATDGRPRARAWRTLTCS